MELKPCPFCGGKAQFEALIISGRDPVKHGRWINITLDVGTCSVCGASGDVADNFCPNCGADMSEAKP